jgi:hypothetical protein
LNARYLGILSRTVPGFGGVAGGVTYPELFFSGDLLFHAGTVIVPETGEPFARFESPFSFTGRLAAYTDAARAGTPVFDSDLIGNGSVELLMVRLRCAAANTNCDPTARPFALTAVNYSFADTVAATPEPSSLVLWSTGALLVALLRRRQSQRT